MLMAAVAAAAVEEEGEAVVTGGFVDIPAYQLLLRQLDGGGS